MLRGGCHYRYELYLHMLLTRYPIHSNYCGVELGRFRSQSIPFYRGIFSGLEKRDERLAPQNSSLANASIFTEPSSDPAANNPSSPQAAEEAQQPTL